MAKLNKETKITLTILTAVVVAYVGYRFMEDLPIFQSTQNVYTYYEKVGGLTVGSYIYMSGVKVGSVQDFKLVNKDSVRVELGFRPDMTVTKGAVAVLKSTGLLGGKAIYIKQGRGLEPIPAGGVIPGIYESGIMQSLSSEAESIASGISTAVDRLNAVILQLQDIVDKDTEKNIDHILTNLKVASQNVSTLLKKKRQELASSIEHANDILATLDTLVTQNRAALDSTIANLKQTTKHLEKVSGSLKTTVNNLNSILIKIDEGHGTLGLLVNDSSLYHNLDSLSAELDELIENINKNPGKYLKHLQLIEIF